MENYLYSLYQTVLKSLTFYLGVDQEKKKAGRPSKVSDLQLCASFTLSYITNTPVFTLAKSLIDPNIKSYHLFRKTKTQKVYRLLKEYRNRRILSILFVKLLLGKKVKLIVDGTVLKDKGVVYDLWFHPASYHEVRFLRIRYRKSKWLRFLVDSFRLMGDRGYRGCEYVEVCESKEQKGIRQVVEGVNSQIKVFNRVSRWRKGITLLAYLYGYAIGPSFFQEVSKWG